MQQTGTLSVSSDTPPHVLQPNSKVLSLRTCSGNKHEKRRMRVEEMRWA